MHIELAMAPQRLQVFNTADGSYNGNYEVTIPEPTELALLVAGLTGFLGLRRKAVKA